MTTDKKALIEKLIQDKHITLDEGLLLLETEKEYISTPAPYPVYPHHPYNPWPSSGYWRWNGWQMEWVPNYNPATGVLTIGDSLTVGSYQPEEYTLYTAALASVN